MKKAVIASTEMLIIPLSKNPRKLTLFEMLIKLVISKMESLLWKKKIVIISTKKKNAILIFIPVRIYLIMRDVIWLLRMPKNALMPKTTRSLPNIFM
jgi:hypothetical protein